MRVLCFLRGMPALVDRRLKARETHIVAPKGLGRLVATPGDLGAEDRSRSSACSRRRFRASKASRAPSHGPGAAGGPSPLAHSRVGRTAPEAPRDGSSPLDGHTVTVCPLTRRWFICLSSSSPKRPVPADAATRSTEASAWAMPTNMAGCGACGAWLPCSRADTARPAATRPRRWAGRPPPEPDGRRPSARHAGAPAPPAEPLGPCWLSWRAPR